MGISFCLKNNSLAREESNVQTSESIETISKFETLPLKMQSNKKI